MERHNRIVSKEMVLKNQSSVFKFVQRSRLSLILCVIALSGIGPGDRPFLHSQDHLATVASFDGGCDQIKNRYRSWERLDLKFASGDRFLSSEDGVYEKEIIYDGR